jgi:hypothetical protein
MKRIVLIVFSITFLCFVCALASAQEAPPVCDFSIVGTWQQSTEGLPNRTLLRFNPNGVVSVLSPKSPGQGPEMRAMDWSTYKLDNFKAPKTIRLSPIKKNGEQITPGEITTIDITKFDDGSFTSVVTSNAGEELSQWTRVDRYRYFVILAAGKATPGYGGPAFAMLIKTDGHQSQTEAFGLYETDAIHHYVEMGTIAEETRKKFDNDPRDDSAAMLRLEVSAGPYQRALKVLKTWERRARENTLLYQDIPYLNNAVYLNQLASSLNDCSETIKLHKLTWRIDDPIITKQNLPQVPYFFIKELRGLNSTLHIKDDKFHQELQAANHSATQ